MNSNDKLAEAVKEGCLAYYEHGGDVIVYPERIKAAILAADAILHPPVEGEWVMVPCGAFRMAVNVLRRTGKDEVADQLERDSSRGAPAPPADKQDGNAVLANAMRWMLDHSMSIESKFPVDDELRRVFDKARGAAKDAAPAPVAGESAMEDEPSACGHCLLDVGHDEGCRGIAEEATWPSNAAPAPSEADEAVGEITECAIVRWFKPVTSLGAGTKLYTRPQTEPAPAVGGVLDRTAPSRIWLQVDCGASKDYRDEPFPADHRHVTWEAESIGGLEVEYVRADLAHLSATQDDARDAERYRTEGHDTAIRYVFGYLNGTGDCGSTMYEEILNGCGRERLIQSAIDDGELAFTGLGHYLKEYGTPAEKRKVRAAIAARAEVSP